MQLCNNDHDDICFDSRYCPLCDMKEDYEDLIDDLKDEIRSLCVQIDELENNTD